MIEASSPLAAMQPPAFLGHCGGGYRADAPPGFASSFAAAKSFATNSFNFRDLSMKKPKSDYFSLKSVRGSSPTASLAADLSQNFHIDQRSVPSLQWKNAVHFSANKNSVRKSQLRGDHSFPIACSHRTAKLQSPTPDLTPSDTSLLSIPSPPCGSPTEPFQINLPQDRRKQGFLRPTLTRAKGFSTGNLAQRPTPESQLPPFKFGNGNYSSKPATSSSLSLSEIFADSPGQEKAASRLGAPVFAPPRSRPSLTSSGHASRNGSPVGTHMRKTSNPLVRPRKQFRRSLSMFEHPEDIMKQEKERLSPPPLLPSIMDVEAPHVPQLPHFVPEDETGCLPRISKETMVSILDGHFDHLYEKRVIIDCRFEYEYDGGHIEGAVNFNDKEKLSAQLFDVEPTPRALLIFHCEYSAHRAPLMAKYIRNKDRAVNADRYPALTYPEAYILDGGYSTFFKDYRSRCYPQNYVEMDAKEYVLDCERGLGKVKQRSKLLRAQTFAFGQHSPSLDSSPTAMGRRTLDCDMDLDMTLQYTPVAGPRPGVDALRARNHRMLSY
ncbi:M-phase inducer phosphatase [Fonsecaea pedrosoi]|nr:M-phase inducer phosphatase [Fonsecaea pedrosoi]